MTERYFMNTLPIEVWAVILAFEHGIFFLVLKIFWSSSKREIAAIEENIEKRIAKIENDVRREALSFEKQKAGCEIKWQNQAGVVSDMKKDVGNIYKMLHEIKDTLIKSK